MYLAVNLTHHIATFGGVLLLTASYMISHLLKYTGSPPHLPMLMVEAVGISGGGRVEGLRGGGKGERNGRHRDDHW